MAQHPLCSHLERYEECATCNRVAGGYAVRSLVLVAALYGCAEPRVDVTVYVQAGTALHESAVAAANQWNACGSRQVHVVTSPRLDALPLEVSSLGFPGTTTGRMDAVDDVPTRIVIRNGMVSTSIVAHEIGHALMPTVEHFGHGVMQAKVHGESVTAGDCAALRSYE